MEKPVMTWSVHIFVKLETSTWLNEPQIRGQEKALNITLLCFLSRGGRSYYHILRCWQKGHRAWCSLECIVVSTRPTEMNRLNGTKDIRKDMGLV